MEAELLTCGYSFHMEPFNVSTKSGLQSYLFRLQTEGTCEVLVDGRMVTELKPVTYFFLNRVILMNYVSNTSPINQQ